MRIESALNNVSQVPLRHERRLARLAAIVAALLISTACGGNTPTSPTPSPPITAPAPPTDPQPPAPSPPMPPAPAPRTSRTRFLAFGDSITAGTTSPALNLLMTAGLPQSYPFKLKELLSGRYTEQSFTMVNEGKPAEAAEDGVLRLPALLRAVAPEVVILLHGVNDITFQGQSGVNRTIGFLNTMARDARFSGAHVILCTLLPQRPSGSHAANPAVLTNYNQRVRDLARGEGALLIDFETDFGDLSLIGRDGLHPTEAGYSRMAQMVFDLLRQRFEVTN